MEATTSTRLRADGEAGEPGEAAAPVLARIDPPHALSEPVEAAPPAAEKLPEFLPSPAPVAPQLAEQLRVQALQLGTLLRAKQQQLDHREAQLNALDAKLENELRLARLWSRERQEDDARREADFRLRQQVIEEQTAQLAAAAQAANRDTSALDVQLALREQLAEARDAELQALDQRLAAESEAIAAAQERLEQQRVEQATAQLAAEQKLAMRQLEAENAIALQHKNFEQMRRALDEREQQLDARHAELSGRRDREAWEARLASRQGELEQAETLLAAHARELDEGRAALAAEREKLQAEARDERRALAEWQQRERAELAERKQQLALGEETLDQHRAAVEQLRFEAARLHREAIEMRLVAEQLWLELARHVATPDLTRSLATLRQRLAEHYRDATDRQAAQQAELIRLGTRLDEQHERLTQQREQLREWLTAQQQDIECQAARLVAREQQLDAEESQAKERQAAWLKERSELRREIRDLLARLRKQEFAAL